MEIHELQQLLSEMSLQEKIGQMVQLTGVYFDKEAVLTGVVGEQLPPEWIIQYAGSVLGVIGKDKIYDIQSRYMEQLAESYAALLAGLGKASDKFWELEKRLRKDKKRVGVVADVSRSEMYYNLLYLLDDKTITLEDLAGFSPDLRERLAMIARDHFV